jgi:hypothetical protein
VVSRRKKTRGGDSLLVVLLLGVASLPSLALLALLALLVPVLLLLLLLLPPSPAPVTRKRMVLLPVDASLNPARCAAALSRPLNGPSHFLHVCVHLSQLLHVPKRVPSKSHGVQLVVVRY